MDGLKSLAFKEIAASVDRLTPSEVVEEMFSVFTSRQDPPTKTVALLLTYRIDIRNSILSTSRCSNQYYHPPSDTQTLFNGNYLVIFLGNFHTAGTFLHPYYNLSWIDPPLVTPIN